MAIYTLLETVEKFPRHKRVTSGVPCRKNVASHACKSVTLAALKGQYHGGSMGDVMIFGQNSLTLNFEHCVT